MASYSHLSFEEKVLLFLKNDERIKEIKEMQGDVLDDIAKDFALQAEQVITIPIDLDTEAVVKKHYGFRQVLDKEELANMIRVSKDDLKTTLDIAILVKQGKLAPDDMKACTHKVSNTTIRVRRKKRRKSKKGRK